MSVPFQGQIRPNTESIISSVRTKYFYRLQRFMKKKKKASISRPVLLENQTILNVSKRIRRGEYRPYGSCLLSPSITCKLRERSFDLKLVDKVIAGNACFQLQLPPASFQTPAAYPSTQQTITCSAITLCSINISRHEPCLLCLSNIVFMLQVNYVDGPWRQ
jgi:hypothetical protein